MKKLMAVLLVVPCLFALSSVAQAAGDASAIRRATRTQDSRWVSNYRPGASNYGTNSRGSSYRRYSPYMNRNSAAVTNQPAAPVKTAQPKSKSPVR